MPNKNISAPIRNLLKQMHAGYKESLSLPQLYKYLHGNPINPVVPLDVARDGVFIIGAYPSAQFATIGSEKDVPVADNCGPFSTERYFDGSRIRTVDSGAELEEAYLKPLDLQRHECWITDQVKVFLFKEGHLKKYRRLGCDWPPRYTRHDFETFAREGMYWLQKEVEVARPKVIITLGREVAGILQGVSGDKKRNALLNGDLKELSFNGKTYPAIHLAHPGIVMRKETDRNPWPRRHREEHIPAARENIHRLLAS